MIFLMKKSWSRTYELRDVNGACVLIRLLEYGFLHFVRTVIGGIIGDRGAGFGVMLIGTIVRS
jgi:hypothetical protein